MEFCSDQKVPFWPSDSVIAWGKNLPCMIKDKIYLKEWPEGAPDQDSVFCELERFKRCWIRRYENKQGKESLVLLVGRYRITISFFKNNVGDFRTHLSAISFATNFDRGVMLKEGIQLSIDGISALSGNDFRLTREKTDLYYKNGTYVSHLLSLIDAHSAGTVLNQALTEILTSEQEYCLDYLRAFVEAEYEQEQLAANQELPFSYISCESRAAKTIYRQHYSLTLLPKDYERILTQKPKMLVLLNEEREPTNVVIEVTDFEPFEDRPIIDISIEKQVEDCQLPKEGELGLKAVDVLKQVRLDVLENIQNRATDNPWLLDVAAKTYEAPQFEVKNVDIPNEGKFGPTKSQERAIKVGISTPDYSLVLGPPGTGKTTVILSWVRYFVGKGKRILVTSQNNKAVDNVLERLMEEPEFNCLRIGNENKVSSALEPIILDNKAAQLQQELFKQTKNSLDKLTKATDIVSRLLENSSKIVALKQRLENIQDEIEKFEIGIKNKEVALSKIIASQEKSEFALKSNEAKIAHTKAKRWPGIFNYLLLPFKKYSLYQLRKDTSEVESTIKKYAEKKKGLKQEKAELRGLLLRTKNEHTESARILYELLNYEDVSLVEELELPNKDAPAEHFSHANLAALMSKINDAQHAVSRWFEKIQSERQQSLYRMLIEKVNVVGATCIGINTKTLFKDLDFDIVIVDESGQIQIHNLIVPLSRAKKVILVGDHKQLPPVVSDEVLDEINERGFEDAEDMYKLSWFEHLWDEAPNDRKVMLDEQFRCPSLISDYVSKSFYDGKYYAGKGTGPEDKKPQFSFCPSPMIFIDTSKDQNRYETSRNTEGRAEILNNTLETKVVVELLRRCLKERPELALNNEVGIIVPYANHVKAIQNQIRQLKKKGEFEGLNTPLNELVASVDSFQGQERDLIIFPFSRSNKRGTVGFLSDWRRLNVAQTRAKKQLIMIGDLSTLAKKPRNQNARDANFKQAVQLLKEFCKDNNSLLLSNSFVNLPKKNTSQKRKPTHQQKKEQTQQHRRPRQPRNCQTDSETINKNSKKAASRNKGNVNG